MVLALLAGRKTQTRRLAWGKADYDGGRLGWPKSRWHRVQPGDRLWVRENFISRDDIKRAIYAADHEVHAKWWAGCDWTSAWGEGYPRSCQTITNSGDNCCSHKERVRWRPSIHMPRWASRLTLTVTDVLVQRLQEISEEDAIAEGVRSRGTMPGAPYDHFDVPGLPIRTEHDPIPVFISLWSHIHGPGAWDANPEVVALTFSVEQRNIDAIGRAA